MNDNELRVFDKYSWDNYEYYVEYSNKYSNRSEYLKNYLNEVYIKSKIYSSNEVNSAIMDSYCNILCPYKEECAKFMDTDLCVKSEIMKKLEG